MNLKLLTVAFAAMMCMITSNAFGQGQRTRGQWLHPSTHGDYWASNYAQTRPWHGGYYHLQTGQPTALVVPPNATMQQNYSWGVSQNYVTPIYSQFGRGAATGGGGGQFRATPIWPSHTDQFGVYPVRAPW